MLCVNDHIFSTFNFLHHFKMRQAFVFTVVIVLISQFSRGQTTELLIESAEGRLLDLRVAFPTDVHNSSDGLHEICKQLHQDGFELSMYANEPNIKSLCDGFKNKQEDRCIVGRCECPEERQFCTNNADSNRKFKKPIIYHDPTEQLGKTQRVPAKEPRLYESNSEGEKSEGVKDESKTSAIIATTCCTLWFCYLIIGAIFLVIYRPDNFLYHILFLSANVGPWISFEPEYYQYLAFRIMLKLNVVFCLLHIIFIIVRCLLWCCKNAHPQHQVNLELEQPEYEQPQPEQPRPERRYVPRPRHTGRRRRR